MSADRFLPQQPSEPNLMDIFAQLDSSPQPTDSDAELSNILSVLRNEETNLENGLKEMRNRLLIEEKPLLCLRAENIRRREECNILRSQLKQLKKNLDKINKERSALLDDPLTKHDYEKLNNVKSKFVLYEQTTGTIFDYTSKEKIQGFIQNDKKSYLKTFSFENDSKIDEILWNEVEKAGTLSCSEHPGK